MGAAAVAVVGAGVIAGGGATQVLRWCLVSQFTPAEEVSHLTPAEEIGGTGAQDSVYQYMPLQLLLLLLLPLLPLHCRGKQL